MVHFCIMVTIHFILYLSHNVWDSSFNTARKDEFKRTLCLIYLINALCIKSTTNTEQNVVYGTFGHSH